VCASCQLTKEKALSLFALLSLSLFRRRSRKHRPKARAMAVEEHEDKREPTRKREAEKLFTACNSCVTSENVRSVCPLSKQVARGSLKMDEGRGQSEANYYSFLSFARSFLPRAIPSQTANAVLVRSHVVNGPTDARSALRKHCNESRRRKLHNQLAAVPLHRLT